MCVLSDTTIRSMGLDQFVEPSDDRFINPASIDIRIGNTLLYQVHMPGIHEWRPFDLTKNPGYELAPGELVLVETFEQLRVPQGYAVEMKLKSSIARQGFNHSLAFWFDPGWRGIGTLEVYNQADVALELIYGMRFAQIIIHRLTEPATNLYTGKYQGAMTVEAAK